MNNNINTNTNNSNIEEEEINLRKIFVILLKNWYLFAIFGMLGIIGGYLASRYSHPDYQVQATIYVPAQKGGISANLEDMFTSQLSGNKAEVFNQIEIIKSFNINDQVARNLNWRTKWFKKDALSFSNLLKEKDIFQWKAYYKDAPFHVEEAPDAFNSPGVEIYLTPVSAITYKLHIDGEVIYNGAKKPVDIETMGTYGQPFQNDYFNFTITPQRKDQRRPGSLLLLHVQRSGKHRTKPTWCTER